MNVYNFKCDNCGATKYIKKDLNTYKCVYCGSEETIMNFDNADNKEQIDEKNLSNRAFDKNQEKMKLLIVKFIMCVVFGSFGIHKFIEKKYILGFVYIFTGGLFGIGIFVDIINYLSQFGALENNSGESEDEE